MNNKTLISSDNYRIRFNSIEKAYYNIEVGDDGNLVIDADTGHALESASGHIPLAATAQEITRFTMLINRMHPYIDNQQLSELTLTYRDYLYELDKSLSHEKSQKETHQALLYKKQLQEKYFGKQAAKKLFGIKSKVLSEKLKIENNNQSI